jgi:hypothetical protein
MGQKHRTEGTEESDRSKAGQYNIHVTLSHAVPMNTGGRGLVELWV